MKYSESVVKKPKLLKKLNVWSPALEGMVQIPALVWVEWEGAVCAAWLQGLIRALGLSFRAWDEFVQMHQRGGMCSSKCFSRCFIICLLFEFNLIERKLKWRHIPELIKLMNTFLPCPDTVVALSLGCWRWGLENGCGDVFYSQVWNFPLSFWKYLLKDRNWSLMVNSLSQTIQANPSQIDFIYPCYYLERIVVWMLLLSKVLCFSIGPNLWACIGSSQVWVLVFCLVCSSLTVPRCAIIV